MHDLARLVVLDEAARHGIVIVKGVCAAGRAGLVVYRRDPVDLAVVYRVDLTIASGVDVQTGIAQSLQKLLLDRLWWRSFDHTGLVDAPPGKSRRGHIDTSLGLPGLGLFVPFGTLRLGFVLLGIRYREIGARWHGILRWFVQNDRGRRRVHIAAYLLGI